jgi:hypothetical protein
MKNTTEEEIIEQAHKNISFKRHLFIFILVNCFLIVLDFLDNRKLDWFHFASLGWGVGLLSHYLMIKPNSLFSVEKEIERLKKNNN